MATEHVLLEKAQYFNKTTVEKKLSEVFVCPPLMRIEVKKKEDDVSADPFIFTKVGYDKIFNIESNVLVFCAAEHGQSSFVKQTALNFLLRNAELKLPRLPLIIDCTRLRNYEASLIGLLKEQAPDLTSLRK